MFKITYFIEKALQYTTACIAYKIGRKPPRISIFGDDYVIENGLGKFYVRKGSDYDYPLQPYVEESHESYWAIEKDGIFLDIGGHVGTYCIKVLAGNSYRKDIVCYSFEPHPETFSYLQKNIELNGLGKQIFGENIAIFSEDKEISFTNSSAEDASISKIVLGSNNHDNITVKGMTLDHWLEKHGISFEKISLIKIDVEGFEYDVFLGCVNLLKQGNPRIICEILDQEKYEKIRSFITKFGYTIKPIDSNNYIIIKGTV